MTLILLWIKEGRTCTFLHKGIQIYREIFIVNTRKYGRETRSAQNVLFNHMVTSPAFVVYDEDQMVPDTR